MSISIRPYCAEDYDGVIKLFEDCYAGIDDNFASFQDMEDLRLHYPDGQIVACSGTEIVGLILSLHCAYAQFSKPQKMSDIYNPALFSTYSQNGDSLFALEILVRSDQKRKGIGKLLNLRLSEVLEQNNLRAFIGVSRVPGYAAVKDKMSIETYMKEVVAGKLQDPSLSYNCSNGMLPVAAIADYYPPDIASAGYGMLVIQQNPHYGDKEMFV